MSAREDCYRLCSRILDGAYSNLAKSGNEGAFAHQWADEVIANKLLLEHILSHYIKKPVGKLDKEVYLTLLIALCELREFDTPENVAVNDSVKLIKSLRKSSASGLVNAVLRSYLRERRGDRRFIPPIKGRDIDKMSVVYSIPPELLKSVAGDYGEDNARLWASNFNAKGINFRYNPICTAHPDYYEMMSGQKTLGVDEANRVTAEIQGDERSLQTAGIKKGVFHVQGISSQLCSLAVGAAHGDTVIDICAAPGGKSFTIAEEMGNEGRVISCDKTQKRVDLIKAGAERLGLGIIEPVVNDGTVFNESFPAADRVLCDVPCSGYGVIHSKPEIRYKPISGFDGLPELQYSILETSSRYVKPGGTLVYSTCTVRRCENEDVVGRFLAEHKDFYGYNDIFEDRSGLVDDSKNTDTELWREGIIRKEHVLRVMGGSFMRTIFKDGCDGFFIAVMRRCSE